MRKRVEMGSVDGVRRVQTVKGNEAVARSNAHRAAIAGADWQAARRARHEALAKRISSPATPTDAANLRRLAVLLYATRYRSSCRPWTEVERLVHYLNEVFGCAQVVFQLTEPSECNRSVSHQKCPFEKDIDHEFEWVHLAFVTMLPGNQPVLPSCGRCCLIPDRCEDGLIAQAVGKLFGLTLPPTLELAPADVQWMRWQAWLLQGQPVPLPLVTVPVSAYAVVTPDEQHSQRTQAEALQLLEQANLVWQQAGISFELLSWYPLQQGDFAAEQWAEALEQPAALAELSEYGPRALHLVFLKATGAPWKCRSEVGQGLLLIRDEVAELAHFLGLLLGLKEVPGSDQLMCANSAGTRLSAAEISGARASAMARTRLGPDTPLAQLAQVVTQDSLAGAPTDLGELTTDINLFLVREARIASQQTLAQAAEWVSQANAIWAQAAIRIQANLMETSFSDGALEAAYPNPIPSPTPRKPSCAALLKADGYDKGILNVFVVHELPVAGKPGQLQPYVSWPGVKVMLLAESYAPQKQLALALAILWGLKSTAQGPFSRLLSTRSPGLRLGPEAIAAARAALASPTARVAISAALGPPLRLPIKLRLVRNPDRGCTLTAEQALAQLHQAELWKQTHIWPEVVSCDWVDVVDSALEETYPNQPGQAGQSAVRIPFNFGLMRLPGYDPLAVNLFVVSSLPADPFTLFSVSKMVIADQQSLALALAQLLGVSSPTEAAKARSTVARLFPAGDRPGENRPTGKATGST